MSHGKYRHIFLICFVALAGALQTGCGDSAAGSSTSSSAAAPPVYLSAIVEGPKSSISNLLQSYTIDSTANQFKASTYGFNSFQEGPQVVYSGSVISQVRGVLNLETTYSYGTDGVCSAYPCDKTYSPPLSGNWAVEFPNHAGGLLQLNGRPVTPLVSTASCSIGKTGKTFLFVTIPGAYTNVSANETSGSWNPQYDTAFGKADIVDGADGVAFSNIRQFLQNGTPVQSYPTVQSSPLLNAYTSFAGKCSQTFYGNTINAPASVDIVNPGGAQKVPPQAVMGVDPSGLLVESNGASAVATNMTLPYQPFLGAGTGAVGLVQPSSPVSINSLTGAQYMAFAYNSGSLQNGAASGWSSTVTSFGFSSAPSTCMVLPTQTSTILYGGDFPKSDPSVTSNCNLAIDFGAQDPSNNGLFPSAKVWLDSTFSGNKFGQLYSFSAVAIAGQVGGKFAVFLVGIDTGHSPNQPWGLYLMQSN